MRTPLRFRIISGDFESLPLSNAESAAYEGYTNPRRKQSWLRARCALKELMATIGERTDTSLVPFPDKRYSISHAGEIAVAVARLDDDPQGMGVDLEICRSLKAGSERFFLNTTEREWIHACNEAQRDDERIRLWTVKEAVYKSDCIAQDGVFKNYGMDSPCEHFGNVKLESEQGETRQFRYASTRLTNELWLTVSLLEG
ncbi:MAG: 4'-phosphopantetheinyl transferase superfamily protein [Candidatus Obscuribacterales bacterium]|nr:4'-phosphopantetheinyl transferase superfamily protein [Candidatus Obscuribacterales bacterium]